MTTIIHTLVRPIVLLAAQPSLYRKLFALNLRSPAALVHVFVELKKLPAEPRLTEGVHYFEQRHKSLYERL